jgi:ribonuclease PH
MNVVRLGGGGLVEVQGTGEGGTFSRKQLIELLDLAESGMNELRRLQEAAMGGDWPF